MAHYNFRRDLAASHEAVHAIVDKLTDEGLIARELPKEEQEFGDIGVLNAQGAEDFIEVKYDLYAKKSGNLCFEMSNGKKPTGIMTTKAHEVYYVVPNGTGKNVFVFETSALRAYIQQPQNVIIKKGGDRKRFDLALVPIQKILDDNLPSSTFKIENSDA